MRACATSPHQAERERIAEEEEALDEARFKEARDLKKRGPAKVAPVDTGFTAAGYKQSLKPGPTRKPRPKEAVQPSRTPSALASASPSVLDRDGDAEFSLPGSPIVHGSPADTRQLQTTVMVTPVASVSTPSRGVQAVKAADPGSILPDASVITSPSVISTALLTERSPARVGAPSSTADRDGGTRLLSPLSGTAGSRALTAMAMMTSPSSPAVPTGGPTSAVSVEPKLSTRAQFPEAGSSKSPLNVAGTGVKPSKPRPLRHVAPVPTALPDYLGPNKYAQALHEKTLAAAGIVVVDVPPPVAVTPVSSPYESRSCQC